MKLHRIRLRSAALALCVAAAVSCGSRSASAPMTWGIVIHTGSGNFTLENLGERREPMQAAMIEALTAGHRVLSGGGSSLDAVQAAIVMLEDSPHFNAGKGAVFTHDGSNELDSSIMEGATRRAGAVAGLKHVRNPIALARLVMEKSPHVMMAGAGAEAFAQSQGVELVPESYFFTQRQWDALQRALAEENQAGTKSSSIVPGLDRAGPGSYFGTVGAVALDQHGNLAAGTSTGGMMNKRYGRIGDSPVIGAGTFASNNSCGISSTGHGEYFIRYSVAHDICARVEYGGVSAQAAADEVVQTVLKDAGGEGGVVGLDPRGGVVMSFNSTGMGRGYMGSDGKAVVMFTRDDAETVGPR